MEPLTDALAGTNPRVPRYPGCRLCLFPPWGPPGRFLYGARCLVSCTMLCPHHHVPHAGICEAALSSAWRCLFTARTAGGASFHLPSRALLIVWPSKLPPECAFLFKSENRMLFREPEWIYGWIISKLGPKPQHCTCSDMSSDWVSTTREDSL